MVPAFLRDGSPQVISFNKKEVMEKRRQERELRELREKVRRLEKEGANEA